MVEQINVIKNIPAFLMAVVFLVSMGFSNAVAQNEPFITIWASDSTGTSDDDQITIPGEGEDYDIEWVEVEEINGEWQEVTGGNSGNETGTDEHTVDFGEAGTYRVEISGDFTRLNIAHGEDRLKILDVEQWGDIEWATMDRAFHGAANLNISAEDAPDLSEVTSLRLMFSDASAVDADLNHWDTSTITDMSQLFASAGSFNGDISDWDTQNVENMSFMFSGASAFNQDIGDWNTGNVTNMRNMFNSADSFNQDISDWNTSNVTSMAVMFGFTDAFNQDISDWNTENVEDMNFMFGHTAAFNQPLGSWDVSNVTTMERMFWEADAFNQKIGDWDTGNVTDMRQMFEGASAFNQDIGDWETDNVNNMSQMFREAVAFDQDISEWNTVSVTNMQMMFEGAESFDQDISSWDTGNVSSMGLMFAEASSFNQDLSDWDTGSLTDMRGMFYRAASFDQNLGDWNVEGVWVMDQYPDDDRGMLDFAGLSDENYGKTLIGWADQDVNEDVELHARGQFYPEEAEDARQTLIDDYNWTIIDEGEALEDGFVTIWQTDNEGGTEDNEVLLPVSGENYFVDWQEVEQVEGEWQEVSGGGAGFDEASDHHTIEFSEPGTYRVEIIGLLDRFHLGYHSDPANSDALKLLEVEKWGEIRWATMEQMFGRQEGNAYGAENMTISAEDSPDLSEVINMSEMFAGAESVNPELSDWNTGNVINFAFMFYNASSFNGDIGSWNTENAQNMAGMFYHAESFDQDLGSLDISGVTQLQSDGQGILDNTALSPENYGNTLISWADQEVEDGLTLGAAGLQFPIEAEEARKTLVEDFNWEINDDGLYEDLGDGFVTVWQTDSTGVSEDDQITIPAEGDDYDIEWTEVVVFEDSWREAEDPVSGSETGSGEHTLEFDEPGTYRVKITGDLHRIHFGKYRDEGEDDEVVSDRLKLDQVEQWGNIEWSTMEEAFYEAENLVVTAEDAPDLTQVTSLAFMFQNVSDVRGAIGSWDTGTIEDMGGMFWRVFFFNEDLGDWNTENVTNMRNMFSGASNFDQDIGDWDTGSVVSMESMFFGARDFNQDIGDWDTGNVEDMSSMFSRARSFNQDIGDWETGNVESMSWMFRRADDFNQDIGNWDVSEVESTSNMFWNADAFDQDIGGWDTGNIRFMDSMFAGAESFNQDISDWDLSSIIGSISNLLNGAESFNQNLGDLNIEDLSSLSGMLSETGLSPDNYDKTLMGWSEQNVEDEVTLGAVGLHYCEAGDERQFLIDEFDWEIEDEGVSDGCPGAPLASETLSIGEGEEGEPVVFEGTATTLTFSEVENSGEVSVERYDQAPEDPSGIGEELEIGNFRIVIDTEADLGFGSAEVRLDADELDVDDPSIANIYHRSDAGEGEFEPVDPTHYDEDNDELYASVETFSEFVTASGELVSSETDTEVPEEFTLNQNYPNPFNPATTIRYDLPEQADVRLEVYNVLGERVATLVNETRQAGSYEVSFDASNLSSGTYIYRLEAGDYMETKQMMFVK